MFVVVKEILFFLKTGSVTNFAFDTDFKLILYVYLLKVLSFIMLVLSGLFIFNLDFSAGVNSVPSGKYLKDFLNFLILAPVLEEIACRYHNQLKVSSVLISLAASCLLFYDKLWFLLIVSLYFFLLLYLIAKNIELDQLFVIYISAFIFGLSHSVYSGGFYGFESSISFFFMFCFRFVGGLLYSYLFFKKGIYWPVILHFFWNLVPFVLTQLSLIV